MDLLKFPSLQLVCVCACADTRPPLHQTNRKGEEADDASGASTAPADDEVCLQCAVPVLGLSCRLVGRAATLFVRARACTRVCVHVCMCARSYVFVYSVHRLSFKRSSSIQFTQNLNFTDFEV